MRTNSSKILPLSSSKVKQTPYWDFLPPAFLGPYQKFLVWFWIPKASHLNTWQSLVYYLQTTALVFCAAWGSRPEWDKIGLYSKGLISLTFSLKSTEEIRSEVRFALMLRNAVCVVMCSWDLSLKRLLLLLLLLLYLIFAPVSLQRSSGQDWKPRPCMTSGSLEGPCWFLKGGKSILIVWRV